MCTGAARDRAVVNTVLSLVSSCIMTFVCSRCFNASAKFDMTAIQNATLAGGVAIGANADNIATPWKSMIIGSNFIFVIAMFIFIYFLKLLLLLLI